MSIRRLVASNSTSAARGARRPLPRNFEGNPNSFPLQPAGTCVDLERGRCRLPARDVRCRGHRPRGSVRVRQRPRRSQSDRGREKPLTGPPTFAPRKHKRRMHPRGSPTQRGNRASCTECGTIASVREIPAWRDVGWRERVDVKGAPRDAGITSTIAIDKAPASERIYEVTVRFRDGTTTVFNESGTSTWRVGNRVIVIAGADPSKIDTRSARSAAAVKTAANDR